MRPYLTIAALAALVFFVVPGPIQANPSQWSREWPKTDFSKHSVPFDQIMSGGVSKDRIPSIDDPRYLAVAEAEKYAATEPVVGLTINGKSRAYPLSILIWHEIVNDVIDGVPVAVTFCPLCNAAVVFDRRVDGLTLEFGTTGKLRYSDLVMYDRQSESWWQQFTGEAIIGERTGQKLRFLPARLESFAKFKARAPKGDVLVPTNPHMRQYGINPYRGYDSAHTPFLYRGKLPGVVAPLARVVAVGNRAWSVDFLQIKERIETEDGLILTFEYGQNSALDSAIIAEGREAGNVLVQRRDANGNLVDVHYRVDFAFAFHAFNPDAKIIVE
ncbi:MAG: DUF3179 domain-containing protein [Alphaproteobacteria bacterium]|jgi:hypothetical protein|nr:DUF3179 domain-containing protein [Alphaproteobacteria bacterium]